MDTETKKAPPKRKSASPKPGVAKRLELEKQLTPKEAKVLYGLAEGKRAPVAVQAAGYDLKGPQAHALSEGIRRKYTDANGYLLVALEEKGVNMEMVADRLKEGLDATYAMKRTVSDKEGGGTIVELIPDFNIRHKYLETALDVMGARAPKKQVTETVTTHEETIAVVEGVRDNPAILAALKRRLEMRTRQITTISNEGPKEVEDD